MKELAPLVIMTDTNKKHAGGSGLTQGCHQPGEDANNESISTSGSPSNAKNQRRTYDASRGAEPALGVSSTDGLRPPVNPQRGPSALSETERKKISRKRMKERRIKQLIPLEALFESENKFSIYFIMKFPRLEIDTDLNVIATDNEIKKILGPAFLKRSQNLGEIHYLSL